MRAFWCLMAAGFAAVCLFSADADARDRKPRVKAKAAKVYQRTAQRSATVGRNGLCQRDTGTPESQLNFRNVCDVEEFWARINDRGVDSGP